MVIKRVARVYGPEKRVFTWAMHDVSVEEPFKKVTEQADYWDCQPLPPPHVVHVGNVYKK